MGQGSRESRGSRVVGHVDHGSVAMGQWVTGTEPPVTNDPWSAPGPMQLVLPAGPAPGQASQRRHPRRQQAGPSSQPRYLRGRRD